MSEKDVKRVLPEFSLEEELYIANTTKRYKVPGIYFIFFLLMFCISFYTLVIHILFARYTSQKDVFISILPVPIDCFFGLVFLLWNDELSARGEKSFYVKILKFLSKCCFGAVLFYDVLPRLPFRISLLMDYSYICRMIIVKNAIFLITSLLSLFKAIIYVQPSGPFKAKYFDYNLLSRPKYVQPGKIKYVEDTDHVF